MPPYQSYSINSSKMQKHQYTLARRTTWSMVTRQCRSRLVSSVRSRSHVLDSYHDVLSIGRRCAQRGFAFSWEPYSIIPTLTKPDGAIINLVSRGCCPFLDDYELEGYNVAAPALGKSDFAYASLRSDVVACESEGDQRLPTPADAPTSHAKAATTVGPTLGTRS